MKHDLVLVGGGLQSSLLALAFTARHPGAKVLVVERSGALGGNHTWSFHEGDLSPRMRTLLAPAVIASWPGYRVVFPGLERDLALPYATMTTESLAALVAPRVELLLGAEAVRVEADGVGLADGRSLEGAMVVDSRGPERTTAPGCGWQKFLGLEVLVDGPVPARPTVMDATVPQIDGFRFLYTLPLGPDRLLVEDTYFSDRPELDAEASRQFLLERVRVREVVREETGCLPIPFASFPVEPGVLRGGMQGGWFHPTTGFTVPAAARLAEAFPDVAALQKRHRRQAGFAMLLNRLLFRATTPAERWRVMERFYRLPDETIGRFHALDTTAIDRLRILCGRPPRGVSLRSALAALESRA